MPFGRCLVRWVHARPRVGHRRRRVVGDGRTDAHCDRDGANPAGVPGATPDWDRSRVGRDHVASPADCGSWGHEEPKSP